MFSVTNLLQVGLLQSQGQAVVVHHWRCCNIKWSGAAHGFRGCTHTHTHVLPTRQASHFFLAKQQGALWLLFVCEHVIICSLLSLAVQSSRRYLKGQLTLISKIHIFPLACSAIYPHTLLWCELHSAGNINCWDCCLFSNIKELDCTKCSKHKCNTFKKLNNLG